MIFLILLWNSTCVYDFHNSHLKFQDFHDFRDSHKNLKIINHVTVKIGDILKLVEKPNKKILFYINNVNVAIGDLSILEPKYSFTIYT